MKLRQGLLLLTMLMLAAAKHNKRDAQLGVPFALA